MFFKKGFSVFLAVVMILAPMVNVMACIDEDGYDDGCGYYYSYGEEDCGSYYEEDEDCDYEFDGYDYDDDCMAYYGVGYGLMGTYNVNSIVNSFNSYYLGTVYNITNNYTTNNYYGEVVYATEYNDIDYYDVDYTVFDNDAYNYDIDVDYEYNDYDVLNYNIDYNYGSETTAAYDCGYESFYEYDSYDCGYGSSLSCNANLRDCYGNVLTTIGAGSSVEILGPCSWDSSRVEVYDYVSGCYGSVIASSVGYDYGCDYDYSYNDCGSNSCGMDTYVDCYDYTYGSTDTWACDSRSWLQENYGGGSGDHGYCENSWAATQAFSGTSGNTMECPCNYNCDDDCPCASDCVCGDCGFTWNVNGVCINNF